MEMTVKKCYTENSFKQLVALLKAEGHTFKGLTWDSAIFNDVVVLRLY